MGMENGEGGPSMPDPERGRQSAPEGEASTGANQGPEAQARGPESTRPQNTWASWLGGEEEISQVKSSELKAELLRISRRPLSMETPEMLEEAYMRIEDLDRAGKLDLEEDAGWGSRIGERHESIVQKEEKEERREGVSGTFRTAAGTALAMETGEEVGKAAGKVIRRVGERILAGKGKRPKSEAGGVAGGGEAGGGGEPPEKPPEEPPKDKDGLPNDFIKLRRVIINDETSEEMRKKAIERRDEMWEDFCKRDEEHKAFIKD